MGSIGRKEGEWKEAAKNLGISEPQERQQRQDTMRKKLKTNGGGGKDCLLIVVRKVM